MALMFFANWCYYSFGMILQIVSHDIASLFALMLVFTHWCHESHLLMLLFFTPWCYCSPCLGATTIIAWWCFFYCVLLLLSILHGVTTIFTLVLLLSHIGATTFNT